MQVLVLRFDYKSSVVVEQLQEQAKLASQTSVRQAPPHLSLLTFRQTNPLDLKRAVETSIQQAQEIPLKFSAIGFFKQTGTFFAAPASSKALLDLHMALQLATRDLPGQSAQYKPENWVPHATIITDISPPFWGPMFARLSMEFNPFEAKTAAIECWTITGDRINTEWSLFLS